MGLFDLLSKNSSRLTIKNPTKYYKNNIIKGFIKDESITTYPSLDPPPPPTPPVYLYMGGSNG
jgi:hypothetical protein